MTMIQWPRLKYTPDPGFSFIKDLRAKRRMWDSEGKEPAMPTSEELERRFTYHAPDEATRDLHNEWREHEKWMANRINDLPGGETREKSLALTALEEQTFWVHAHIARNLHPKGTGK